MRACTLTATLNMIDRTTAAPNKSHEFDANAELIAFLRDDMAES